MLRELKALVPTDVNPVHDAKLSPTDKQRQHEESIIYLWCRVHGYTQARACVQARIPLNRVTAWRGASAQWAELERDCIAVGNEFIEDHAYKLAVEGTIENVFHGGKLIDRKRVYDTGMLAKLLAARLPDKYGTSRKVVTVGGNVTLSPGQKILNRLQAPEDSPMTIESTDHVEVEQS